MYYSLSLSQLIKGDYLIGKSRFVLFNSVMQNVRVCTGLRKKLCVYARVCVQVIMRVRIKLNDDVYSVLGHHEGVY